MGYGVGTWHRISSENAFIKISDPTHAYADMIKQFGARSDAAECYIYLSRQFRHINKYCYIDVLILEQYVKELRYPYFQDRYGIFTCFLAFLYVFIVLINNAVKTIKTNVCIAKPKHSKLYDLSPTSKGDKYSRKKFVSPGCKSSFEKRINPAHTTLKQRRFNVKTLSQRWIDVVQ